MPFSASTASRAWIAFPHGELAARRQGDGRRRQGRRAQDRAVDHHAVDVQHLVQVRLPKVDHAGGDHVLARARWWPRAGAGPSRQRPCRSGRAWRHGQPGRYGCDRDAAGSVSGRRRRGSLALPPSGGRGWFARHTARSRRAGVACARHGLDGLAAGNAGRRSIGACSRERAAAPACSTCSRFVFTDALSGCVGRRRRHGRGGRWRRSLGPQTEGGQEQDEE